MSVLDKISNLFGSKHSNSTLIEQDTFTPDFLRGEAEYRYQTIKREMYAYNEKVRPAILADTLLDVNVSEHLTGMAVCETSINCIEYDREPSFIDDYRQICDFDVLPFLLYRNDNGVVCPVKGENLTLTLFRDNGLPVVMFFKVMYFCSDIVYIRVFSMLSGTNYADDKRVAKGNNLPILRSTMLSCRISEWDISERMNFYTKTEHETAFLFQNGKGLTNKFQMAVFEGCQCRKSLEDYYMYGNKLLQQGRYYDAYRQYARMLKSLDKPAENFTNGSGYGEINLSMAKCLMGLNDLTRAFHYIEVARSFNTKLYKDRLTVMAELADYRVLPELSQAGGRLDEENIQKTGKTYYDGKTWLKDNVDYDLPYISLGFVLWHLLRVHKYNVFSLTIYRIKDEHFDSEFIQDREQLWNMKLEDVLQDYNTLVISYSRHCKECGLKNDKSELCSDGTIIMHVSQIKATDLARVDIMIPCFARDSDKMNPQGDFMPEGTSFIIGMHPNEYDFTMKDTDVMTLANNLCSSFRVVEAMHGFLHVFNSIMSYYYDAREDEQLFLREAAGKIGFCYDEQNMYDVAEYYLSIGVGSHNIDDLTEYVNCIVNMKDVRSMSIIDRLLLQHIEMDEKSSRFFRAFLKRRKAYVLIDWGALSQAREFLKVIQNDPMCKEYATKELLWLEQEEKDKM